MTAARRASGRRSRASMALGEEIEIASEVGLLDVLEEHFPVAAIVVRRGRLESFQAAFDFGLSQVDVDAAAGNIERDLVAGFNDRQWTAGGRFRRNMQHDGAEAGTAHARVRDANDIGDAALQ